MTRPSLRVVAVTLVVAVVAAVAAVLIANRDPAGYDTGDVGAYAGYCAEVSTQQKPLTEAAALGAPQALLMALPSFERLSAKAPDDIVDDWAVVVQRISQLQDALDTAGIDAATFDPDNPPADLSDDDQSLLTAAAAGLATVAMKNALDSVQQQALDVCHVPLSL
ncbi:hypothetical protein BH11ACT8_BH11ACT8_18220 [soil metagenome]